MSNINKKLEKIIQNSVDKLLEKGFGRYSKYVIQQRALPDVRDGLKPVQRRILFAMNSLGLTNDKTYKKSARIVGDVIGKYHPHGDSSVYEAMVNMSQWWKMNIPLLDMHGNVGSIDDDPAAAMRYTEVKMAKVANYILGDIKKNTVNFTPNFDDSEIEPEVLPSILPNLLVNGTKGIAIGMATEMPPHNLGEIIDASIAKIKKPSLTFNELSQIVLGPDFPTGGIIHGNKGILEALDTGKNNKEKIRLFSRYNVFEKGKNKFIEITQIPFGVVKSSLVYEIENLASNEQIDGFIEVKDQSDRNGISILITLEPDANENSIISYLYQKTSLQVFYNYNNTVILNSSPVTANLTLLIDSYITQVKDIKTKTLQYDLTKNQLRLELVLGFIKVSEITDAVIAVIRKAEGSKAGVVQALIDNFNLTYNQANAIAEMKLYRLSKTDKEAFLQEKTELEEQIAKISNLLENEKDFNKFIINQLLEIKKEFATPRKTTILETEYEFNYQKTDLIKSEEVIIGISKHGYLKRISQRVADANDFANYVLKEEDYLIHYEKANTLNQFLIITNLGNYAIIPIYQILECKWKDLGMHLTDFVDTKPNEEIVSIIEVSDWDANIFVVLGTKDGMFKKTPLKQFQVSRLNKTYTAIILAQGDIVVNACLSNGTKDIIIITHSGLSSKYSENDLGLYGTKAKGNKGIYLSLSDTVNNFTIAASDDVITFITDDGFLKKMRSKKIPFVPKNIKGKAIFKDQIKNTVFKISDIYPTREKDMLLIKNIHGNTFLDPIKKYSFSQANPDLIEITLPDLYKVRIKKNYQSVSLQTNTQELFAPETLEQEQKEFRLTEDNLDHLENDLDKLLAKVNETLNKIKK
ncbi:MULTISPECIES: DNA topoisomerase IV subunit A [unclassified Mycoplasma]|uniref:DNA topoisomerase IV subunit A n=1 Tax=unclassified Mycoplasma TaxID=2683645 RepID=UPI00211C07B2|nr:MULTISPECIES: DNA topoisomerase IV subunit A [unclassified Mycoplasma]UUM19858.1 DNA topoisomerase IV subunit A [Mycoplasma sp. 1578d]UUM24842.1 DNA topoisomerase IV subunit A [Mycoplasma sp. 3686d]